MSQLHPLVPTILSPGGILVLDPPPSTLPPCAMLFGTRWVSQLLLLGVDGVHSGYQPISIMYRPGGIHMFQTSQFEYLLISKGISEASGFIALGFPEDDAVDQPVICLLVLPYLLPQLLS